jgi:hypothetical protein
MRNLRSVIGVVVGVLLASATALTHHGGNLYDTTTPRILKDATITKFEWGTPHNQIFFDAKNEKGEMQHWVASTEPAGVMLERGWTRRSLKAGDVVTVYIFAAKNGATVGNLQKIVLGDGKELLAGRGAGPGL